MLKISNEPRQACYDNLPRVVTSDQLGTEVSTAMGNSYAIGEGPTVGGQLIVEADITGTNGVLHIIAGKLVAAA